MQQMDEKLVSVPIMIDRSALISMMCLGILPRTWVTTVSYGLSLVLNHFKRSPPSRTLHVTLHKTKIVIFTLGGKLYRMLYIMPLS